jgi:chemotaxis family two-component system sensor kinase Cph1
VKRLGVSKVGYQLSREAPLVPLSAEDCDKEPIHIPGTIQGHGVLIGFEGDGLKISCISENACRLLRIPERVFIGAPLSDFLGETAAATIARSVKSPDISGANPLLLDLGSEPHKTYWHGILHRNPQGRVILELEPSSREQAVLVPAFYNLIKPTINHFRSLNVLEDLKTFLVDEIKRLTGFERVNLYQFDSDWNGTVVAEARDTHMESYLHHRFPEADIPSQARRLYTVNWLRIIADVAAPNVPILSAESQMSSSAEIDLTHSTLRSVSPIHIEYLKNMKVGSSMSISILRDGHLWGLIACHRRNAHQVPYQVRVACEFFAQIFSYEMANLEEREEFAYRKSLKSVCGLLVKRILQGDSISALLSGRPNALDLLKADGLAVLASTKIHKIGLTPSNEEIQALAEWLRTTAPAGNYSTNSISSAFPSAKKYTEAVSGVLALPLSRDGHDYLFAFRREIVATQSWRGDPHKAVETRPGSNRLHPRHSFEIYREVVKGRANAWHPAEIDAAIDLKESLLFEELRGLNRALEAKNRELDSFSYVASHDLKEPLRTVASYVGLIDKKYRAVLGEEGKRYVDTLKAAAKRMIELIDKLLGLSQAGNENLDFKTVPGAELVNTAVESLASRIQETGTEIDISDSLPMVTVDPAFIGQVFQNLFANAITYRSNLAPRIRIWAEESSVEWQFHVSDNGLGIDSENYERVFDVFHRLHSKSTHPGSGLGLAICKRIIERHGGRIWVDSQLGIGSIFSFTLRRG